MLARHPHHVVVVVCPVDRHGDVPIGVESWLANRVDHHLVVLVAGDRDDLALESLHDLLGERLVVLVRPEGLPVRRGNLGGPHIEVVVAAGSVVVLEGDAYLVDGGDDVVAVHIGAAPDDGPLHANKQQHPQVEHQERGLTTCTPMVDGIDET